MKVYLLRHGKTKEWEQRIRQLPTSELSEVGLWQAERVATRLVSESIDHIVSSPWIRALKTAQIVGKKLKTEVVKHELLHEHLTNPLLAGLSLDHELSVEYREATKDKNRTVDWKFKDGGESMREMINRARKVKEHLISSYFGKNVLVVSHGFFISCLMAVFLAGEDAEDMVLRKISLATTTMENTAISMIELDAVYENWKLRYFNDFSHLKET